MEYQIISADAETGQIQVLYKPEGAAVAIYAVDVPVVDGAFLTGAELAEEIQHRAPVWLETRKQELASATGFDEISALVEIPLAAAMLPEDSAKAANAKMWAQVEYEKRLAATLIKFGLLFVDPTAIEISAL